MSDSTQQTPADQCCCGNSDADDRSSTQEENAAAEETIRRMRRLPPEVGTVLLTVGVVGVIVPGPVGAPLLLAGGLALMPSVFGRVEKWVGKRFPKFHREGIRGVNRFLDDFERRFPPCNESA